MKFVKAECPKCKKKSVVQIADDIDTDDVDYLDVPCLNPECNSKVLQTID